MLGKRTWRWPLKCCSPARSPARTNPPVCPSSPAQLPSVADLQAKRVTILFVCPLVPRLPCTMSQKKTPGRVVGRRRGALVERTKRDWVRSTLRCNGKAASRRTVNYYPYPLMNCSLFFLAPSVALALAVPPPRPPWPPCRECTPPPFFPPQSRPRRDWLVSFRSPGRSRGDAGGRMAHSVT
ncbi:hypothetical protein VTG60DRAFT_3825 [Thermothelomyces hinnuleus]